MDPHVRWHLEKYCPSVTIKAIWAFLMYFKSVCTLSIYPPESFVPGPHQFVPLGLDADDVLWSLWMKVVLVVSYKLDV
uniref:Ovule protein n=1 Tax=Panagrellus redivivus TaxID=6233 RepID=A0A7E4UNV2_PANRE